MPLDLCVEFSKSAKLTLLSEGFVVVVVVVKKVKNSLKLLVSKSNFET